MDKEYSHFLKSEPVPNCQRNILIMKEPNILAAEKCHSYSVALEHVEHTDSFKHRGCPDTYGNSPALKTLRDS